MRSWIIIAVVVLAAAFGALAAPSQAQAQQRCTSHTHSWYYQPRHAKTHVYKACGRQWRAIFLGQFPAGHHWVFGPFRGTGGTSTAYDSFATGVLYYGRQWRWCNGCALHTKTWAASTRTGGIQLMAYANTVSKLGNCWTHTGVGQNWFAVSPHPRGSAWAAGHMKWACARPPRSFLISLYMERRVRKGYVTRWIAYGSTVHSDLLPGAAGITFRVAAHCHTGTWRVHAQVILRTYRNSYRSHVYSSRHRYIANCA